jgi:ABC-type branched-subunit amino acid transport system ATPase component
MRRAAASTCPAASARCWPSRARLALDPELLLLDEPFEGLSPAIVGQIAASIAAIARQGRAILIAESNVHHVPPQTSRLYVIERGRSSMPGRPTARAGTRPSCASSAERPLPSRTPAGRP